MILKLTQLQYKQHIVNGQKAAVLVDQSAIYIDRSVIKYASENSKYGTFICFGINVNGDPEGIFIKEKLEEIWPIKLKLDHLPQG